MTCSKQCKLTQYWVNKSLLVIPASHSKATTVGILSITCDSVDTYRLIVIAI